MTAPLPSRTWLSGILPLRRRQLAGDVLAGITLAALAIPEVMGYTRISQTPVVTGLYTMLLPMLAFAVLGASRHWWWRRTPPLRRSWRPPWPG